jgi:hypothetical protein
LQRHDLSPRDRSPGIQVTYSPVLLYLLVV